MTLSQSLVCTRLSALGWNQRDVHHMVDTIDKWCRNSGHEWTAARLKQMKVHLIRTAACEPSSPEWLALHPGGSFKGAFRRLSLHGTWKQRIRTLNTVMVYSGLISDKVTLNQWGKFQSSVELPETSEFPLDFEDLRMKRALRSFPKVSGIPYSSSLRDLVLSKDSRAPCYSPQSGRIRTVSETDIDGWMPTSVDTPFCRRMSIRYKGQGPFDGFNSRDEIGDLFSKMPTAFEFPKGDPEGSNPDWVGKISFIQEPGFKLRAVANPNRLVQLALDPLKVVLLNVLKRMKSDYTFDQGRGVEVVQGWLQEGHTVHSVDLSDATNNFPLDFQLSLLKELLPSEWMPWINLFEDCSKGPWRVMDPVSGQEREMVWAKGQPLGLGPSFPCFALAHHLVLRLWMSHLGMTEKGYLLGQESPYVILGDDICIRDWTLASMYKETMRLMGCPISEEKSIDSNSVAEFAGKVIFPEGHITPYKWRETSDRNFVDLSRNLGQSALGLLRPRQRRVARAIAEIPEDLGGLGWNPQGKPLKVRLEEHSHTIRKLEATSAAVPYSAANRLVEQWLNIRQLNRARWNPWVLERWPEAAQARPAPASESSPRKRILDLIQPHEEVGVPNDPDIPKRYRPFVRMGDPRGRSTLEVLEDRLDLCALPKSKEERSLLISNQLTLG